MKQIVPLIAFSLTTACIARTPAPAPIVAQPAAPVPGKTRINDRAAFQRLLGNGGITLQWISWDLRGDLTADYTTDLLRLHGGQTAVAPNRGTLMLDGVVTRIDANSFTFVGRIDIKDTPDVGRDCHREGEMIFAVTQNRKYWRLQQMEVCDGLTDYVDIYF